MALMLASGLASRGYRVKLIIHEKTGPLKHLIPENVEVKYFSRDRYSRRNLPLILFFTLRESVKSDILIAANEGRAGFFIMVSSFLLKRPAVAWIHTNWEAFLQHVSWRTKISLRLNGKAACIVAVSKGVMESFNRIIGANLGRSKVIYNGIDLKGLHEASSESLLAHHEDWFSLNTVVAVGRLSHEKGFDVLIKSIAVLHDKGVKVNLVIVGQGPLEKELVEEATRLGISEHVRFAGFQQNPYKYMAKTTVFAMSSRFEGFGIVIAEALACGAAVVAADCPSGPREILDGGRYGVLVQPEDPEAMAKGLESLLVDEERRKRLMATAKERAAVFGIDNFLDDWSRLIDRLHLSRKRD